MPDAKPKVPAQEGTPTQAAAPAPRTITLQVPEGVDPAVIAKGFKTFTDLKVRGKAMGQAETKALKRLKEAHAPEYHQYRIAEYKARGLDASKIK